MVERIQRGLENRHPGSTRFVGSNPTRPSSRHKHCTLGPPIPVAGMLPAEQPHPLTQPVLVGHPPTLVALPRAVLADHAAGSPLGHPETTLQSARCSAASLRG